MPTTYLGNVTVAGVIPPVQAAYVAIKIAVEGAFASIRAGLELLVDAKASIRAVIALDLEAQLSASLNVQAQLSVSILDPIAYLNGLLAALIQVQKSLLALQPQITLSAQLSASLAISIELTAKLAALDLALSVLLQIKIAIEAALNVAFPSLPTAPGVYVFDYSGSVAGLGSSLDGVVSADSGLSGATSIRAIVILCDAGNAGAIAGLEAVFLTA